MKSMTTKLMLTAAALAITTGIASAQSYRAEIPFAFQASGKTMSAGSYELRIQDAVHKAVVISNFHTRQSAILMPNAGAGLEKSSTANDAPVLTFDCGVGRCALARLWTGSLEPVLTFPHRRLGNGEQASLTEIRLVKVNGD